MSFVPVTGPATFEAVEPARDSVVVFTDDHRTVSLPIRAALPVLTRAHQRDDAHPTVGLLAGAVLLAMRMVAAGKIEPDQRAGWQIAELDADDQDRLERLVEARAPEAVADPTTLVRSVMDAVADAMPRSGSQAGSVAVRRAAGAGPSPTRGAAAGRAARVLRPAGPAAGPAHRCRRGRPPAPGHAEPAGRGRRGRAGRRLRPAGAPGPRRAQPAALRRCRAALDRVRTRRHARLRRPGPHPRQHRAAGRGRRLAGARPAARAAGARRDHPRRGRARRPARGRPAGAQGPRRRRAVAAQPGPRPDRGDRAPPRVREAGGAAHRRALRPGLAVLLHLAAGAARRPAHPGGDGPAGRGHRPGGPAPRQLDGRRPGDGPPGEEAAGPHRQARAGAGRHPHRRRHRRGRRGEGPRRRHAGEGARADHLRGHPRAGAGAGGAAGRAARLPEARADLAGRADRPRARRLPGRRHGPGQDDHA